MARSFPIGPRLRTLRRIAAAAVALVVPACEPGKPVDRVGQEGDEVRLARERESMVSDQIEFRGLHDARVLAAMRVVPRHRFAPGIPPIQAYEDRPHPIGQGQTISQPYMVAWMSELAATRPPCKVLEVGTGSGYQAAVLAEMGCTVFSIEIVAPLAQQAERILEAAGYGEKVHVRTGDGYLGWPEEAPFDAVLVTAAAPRVPQPLLDQLRVGAKLVIPVGESPQTLEVHTRTADGFEHERVGSVHFVPMTGEVRR